MPEIYCAIAVNHIEATRAAVEQAVTDLVARGMKAIAIEAEVTNSQACRVMAAMAVRTRRNIACGGGWVGVVQVLAGCGESCGLPMPANRSCVISAWPVNPVKN